MPQDSTAQKGIIGGSTVVVDPPAPDEPVGGSSVVVEERQMQFDPGDEKDFYANLALFLDSGTLGAVSNELLRLIDQDTLSRKRWEEMCLKSMDVLGLTIEDRVEPFKGASGIFHPMLLDAIIRFQSETIRELCPGASYVKTKIIGPWTEDKQDRANQIETYMNDLLQRKMRYWRRDKEHALFILGLTGASFSKTYWDMDQNRTVVDTVEPQDFIVPYGFSNLDKCTRYTHVMRKTLHDIRRLQIKQIYRDIQISPQIPNYSKVEKQEARYFGYQPYLTQEDFIELYECHTLLDLFEDTDGDGLPTGLALPYIVTMERQSGEILGLYRNWRPHDSERKKRKYFTGYQFVPAFGSYGIGMAHILGNLSKAATTIYRQLIDSGSLSNFPGGYKNAALKIRHDTTPHRPGEWREASIDPAIPLGNCFFKLPYGEPSATLHQLVQEIVDTGRRSSVNADIGVSDLGASKEVPVGTILALLERTLKTITAIQARVHESVGEEFELIAETEAEFNRKIVVSDDGDIKEVPVLDYDADCLQVQPVSDPNSSTLAQRMLQMQALLGIVSQYPQAFDVKEVARQYLYALGFQDVDTLLSDKDEVEYLDPVLENMCILTGRPVKAYIDQDHESHIQVHQAVLQDPLVQQAVQTFNNTPVMTAAMQAHIAEHVGFAWRKRVETALGSPLPRGPLPPEVQDDSGFSQLLAQAAQQTLQNDQAQAAQQQAQQQAQDPVLQQQQAELQLKQQQEQHKEQTDNQKLQLEQQRQQQDSSIRLAQLQEQQRQFALKQMQGGGNGTN
jgi:hypothetical protein